MTLAIGSLVKHVSLGVGKVVAVEPTAIHVFFPERDKRHAAKLRWPVASALLTQQGLQPDAWLTGLTSFALDPKSGRYALAANFLTHDQAVAEFVQRFPLAFEDPQYLAVGAKKRERAAAWRAAVSAWAAALGNGQAEQLLADGDLDELVRRALRAAREVTCVPGVMEHQALEEALEPGDEVAAFLGALVAAVSERSASKQRFDRLAVAAGALGVAPDLAWPMVTLLPAIAAPSVHALLAPRSACAAAARLGCDVRFKAAPNWTTYAAWRGLAAGLLQELESRGARDLTDAEVFLHVLGSPPSRKRS